MPSPKHLITISRARGALGRGVVAATIATALSGGTALAGYTHDWGCNRASGSPCYDYVGSTYNPWEFIAVSSGSHYEVCGKARTAAQNIRDGSGCDYYTNQRYSNINGGYPESAAYVYWGGSGGNDVVAGRAGT